MIINKVSYDANGFIPAIVQDVQTGDVLMLAYMNEEALKKTIETKETWFYSRSRQELWNKGASSGNRQEVKRLSFDCDRDAVLVEVSPLGPACHLGKQSCFFEQIVEEEPAFRNIVHELVERIHERKNERKEGSYTSYLMNEGLDKVLKKVGEEASEVIIGAKNHNQKELTSELADLLYHALVLMEITEVSIEDVKKELLQRKA